MDWLFALIVWAAGLLCALAFFAGARHLKEPDADSLRVPSERPRAEEQRNDD